MKKTNFLKKTLPILMILIGVAILFMLYFQEQSPAQLCKSQGGEYRRVGIDQFKSCVIYYSDAGKYCTDGTQCLGGQCLGRDETSTNGTCTYSANRAGCASTITNGQASEVLCIG